MGRGRDARLQSDLSKVRAFRTPALFNLTNRRLLAQNSGFNSVKIDAWRIFRRATREELWLTEVKGCFILKFEDGMFVLRMHA